MFRSGFGCILGIIFTLIAIVIIILLITYLSSPQFTKSLFQLKADLDTWIQSTTAPK